MNLRSSLGHATLVVVIGVAIGASGPDRQQIKSPEAAKLANPVASTPESLGVGKRAYDTNCAACHGNLGQGAAKAGVAISIIAEQGGKQPPDLTDDQWDNGSTDGEIYTVIRRGLPPTMMAGWEGRISDHEIWSIVNYLRALATKKEVTVVPAAAVDSTPRQRLELADYVQAPITADNNGDNTRAELARINFMRDEPGGRRFFITDLNGPLYIFDKQSKRFTTYLDFNGLAGRPGLFQKLTFERNFATGLINVLFDPDYSRNGVFYTIHMTSIDRSRRGVTRFSRAPSPLSGVKRSAPRLCHAGASPAPTPLTSVTIPRNRYTLRSGARSMPGGASSMVPIIGMVP